MPDAVDPSVTVRTRRVDRARGVRRAYVAAVSVLAAAALVLAPAAGDGVARADGGVDAEKPGAAGAAGYSNSTNSLLTPTLRAAGGGPWTPVLRLAPITARKGQKFYLQTQLATTSNVTRGPMIGARIVCLATGGGGGSPYTTRNHTGKAAGVRSVVIRWVFKAPADNTYRCEVRGRADTSLNPARATLTLQSASYLRVRRVSGATRQWGDSGSSCAGKRRIPGHRQCATAREVAKVLDRRIRVGRQFTAGVDVQLTREYGMYPGGTARVRTTQTIVQLRSDGKACAAPRRSRTETAIDSNLHHLKLHLTIANVKVSSAAGCTKRFRVRTYVRSLAGNPVLIHNRVYSNAFAIVT